MHEGEIALADLVGCDRCGENHIDAEALPLTLPQKSEGILYTHYVLCPTNGEPIFVGFYDEANDDTLWADFRRSG